MKKSMHHISSRKDIEIKSPWFFQIDQNNLGEVEEWFSPKFDFESWMSVKVPAAWENYDVALRSYEGIGWFATKIPSRLISKEGWHRLLFGSVHNHSKVWLNGHLIAEHFLGGYLPYEAAIKPFLVAGPVQTLVLRVDNEVTSDLLPGGQVVEWVQYGGIRQPIRMVTTATTYLSHFAIEAKPAGKGASVLCRPEIHNTGSKPVSVDVKVKLVAEGRTVTASLKVEVAPESRKTVDLTIELAKVRLWSPETPVLYTAEAQVSEAGGGRDTVKDRFGVRTIEVRGTQVLLNGKPIELRGYNRYDEVEGYGTTVPESVIRKDLLTLKASGANLVRVHFPQDPVHLRIMDEIGLLFMEEIPLNWWRTMASVPPEENHDRIIDRAEQALEVMIRRDRNHPCLIIWSMCNECRTDDEMGIRAMRRLLRRTAELDSSRLRTFVVAGKATGHEGYDEADLICPNWYWGLFHGELANHISDFEKLVYEPTKRELEKDALTFPGKPILMAEFGCQSIRGFRADARFSERYQAEYLLAVWRAVKGVPNVVGAVVWAWADYHHRRGFTGKRLAYQGDYGPYGVVTVDRKLKQGYLALSKVWKGRKAKALKG